MKGKLVSRAELADIFGVTPPTVDRWVAQRCPVAKEGGRGRAYEFNTAKVREWREQIIRDDVTSTAQASEQELLRRELSAKTELAELKLAKEKGLVAPVADMQRAMTLAFAKVRTAIRTVTDRVPRMIVAETDEARIKAVLGAEIDQALKALSTETLVIDDDVDPDAGDEE